MAPIFVFTLVQLEEKIVLIRFISKISFVFCSSLCQSHSLNNVSRIFIIMGASLVSSSCERKINFIVMLHLFILCNERILCEQNIRMIMKLIIIHKIDIFSLYNFKRNIVGIMLMAGGTK
jgi:hypothetical protein